MARTNKKPRKGSPSKVKYGKEKKQVRTQLDRERERERLESEQDARDPYYTMQESIAAEFGCEPEDLGECMRCGSPWPSGMKKCPECGWDGKDLGFMLPIAMPRIWS